MANYFSSTKKRVKLPPQYWESMNELLARGKETVSMPTQGVAPLSELEQVGIEQGRKFIESTDVTDVDRASQIYQDIAAPGDILDRPEVKGITAKAIEEGNLMLNRIGRGMVTRGSFATNTGRDILGRGITSIQERIAGAMSEYLNAAENRKLGAAGGLERTGAAKETSILKKVGTAMDLGSLTRSISQMIKDAQYNKEIADINFRFNTQPQLLQAAMGGAQAAGVVKGGEPSMFSQHMSMLTPLLSASIMAGGAGGAGGVGSNVPVTTTQTNPAGATMMRY